MILRLLRADEIVVAARQHRVAGAMIPGFDPSLHTLEETFDFYRNAFARGPIWGAFDGDELVGHLALEPGWIEHLYVEPARHGQGIGRALLGMAQREQGDLQLWTYQANERARRMYEAAGFVAEEYGFDPEHEDRVPNVRYRWRRKTWERRMSRWQLEIVRDDIATAETVDAPERDLASGEAEFAIDLVALTANNVTYAALGQKTPFLGPDAGYWDFFSDADQPGHLPVWGFATVCRSTVEGVSVGDQFYGYWPLASHAVLQPGNIRGPGFVDISKRRSKLPGAYNGYTRLAALADYRAEDRDWWPIYRPLFMTGWLIGDQFEDDDDYGVDAVIVSGASSKTAIGFAHTMKVRGDGPRRIGLASARSADFTRSTGYYDEVVDYDAIESIATGGTVAFVDFAGNPTATRAVHDRFGDDLTLSMIVGITHWDAERGDTTPLPGPRPVGFFAPGRMEKRAADWGAPAYRRAAENAWLSFVDDAKALTAIDRRSGGEAALAAYRDAVAGKVDPRMGVLIEP